MEVCPYTDREYSQSFKSGDTLSEPSHRPYPAICLTRRECIRAVMGGSAVALC
jgi:hypothetical protein